MLLYTNLFKGWSKCQRMQDKIWPLFEYWDEIFGKYRAIDEFAKDLKDAIEEIKRNEVRENF